MPCVSGRAEMSSVRDAVVVRAFRRECGILTLFNGPSKALPEVLAVADAISPPMTDPRVDHGQRHGVRCR